MATQAQDALASVKFIPFWLDSDDTPPAEPALRGKIECDLLVVGGGFTGLWAALQAKEQNPGRNIVLIEAKSVANGASGRPGAIISKTVMHGLANAHKYYPAELETLEQLGVENLNGFKDAIERHGIECDLEWGGEMTVAIGSESVAALEHEKALHDRFHDDTVFLDEAEVQKEVNSPLFSAGLWQKAQCGTVNPAKVVWGLKAALVQLGVRVYENTPLRSVEKGQNGLKATTRRGSITAKKILLATNAFASGHKHIRRRVAAIRDRIIMTEPLTPEQLARVGWKNRQGIYDTRTQLNYMRLTTDNRILFGGRLDYAFGNAVDPDIDRTTEPYVRLAQAFFRTFPCLADVRFSHAWSGPIALTTRKVIHFQQYFGGNMLYAGGYSGFGVTASRFGAGTALALLDGQETEATRLTFAQTVPGYIPPEPFRWIGAKITMHALDTVDKKGGWRRIWVNLVQKMGFPLFIE